MWFVKAIHSISKLAAIVLASTARIAGALLRGRLRLAAEHTRVLMWTVHQDALQFVVLVQRILSRGRVPRRDIDRVLVIRLDRIGDMVNTTPVLDALHALFPRARVDVLGHPASLELLVDDDRVGERIAYRSWLYHPQLILPPGPRTWWLVLKLLRRRYPLVVYLRGSYSLLALGLVSRLAAFKYVEHQPIVDQIVRPLETLYGPVPHERPRLHVSAAAARFGRAFLTRHDDRMGPALVIHAAASNPTKTWPLDRMAALADELAELHGARVHFLGAPADQAALRQIASLATRTHTYHCTLGLSQVVGVIAACDLFIGNDSGLSHIAAATGVPTIVLWGSAKLAVCRPATANALILHHDLPCRATCREIVCNNRATPMECLKRIESRDVLTAAERILRKTSAPSPLAVAS
jgi:ADP-heptose:LPS heptosyltransferase